MSTFNDSPLSTPASRWRAAVERAFQAPEGPVDCPVCQATSCNAAWYLVDIETQEALVEVTCASCQASQTMRLILPAGVPRFFPLDRARLLRNAIDTQLSSVVELIGRHVRSMPAAAFATHSLWAEARWSATTFQWHPTSEAPPIMGLVFDNAEAGKEIFREAERQMNHTDRFEEIWVSIIEGPVPGQEHRPGYSVHVCADPEALAAHATAEEFVVDPSIVPFLGQWNRHYPVPGTPALLPKFKQEFAKHKEYLLAPVTRRDDGKLYADPMLGIIKKIIHFRSISDITAPDDPDAAALVLPQLIMPPT